MATLFSERLRKRRRELAMTLKDIAESAGCSIPYVSELERGMKEPPPEGTLHRLARALRIDADELQELAQASRKSLEFDLESASPMQKQLAIQLHRRFRDGLSDREAQLLLEQIQKPEMPL